MRGLPSAPSRGRTLPAPCLVPEYARELVLQRSLPECVAVLPGVDTLPRVQNVQHDVRYDFLSQCIDLRHVRPVRWVGFDVVGRSRIIESRMMPSEELVDVDHAYAFLPCLF